MVQSTSSGATWASALTATDWIAWTVAAERTTARATAMAALAIVKRWRSVSRFQNLTISEETYPSVLQPQSPSHTARVAGPRGKAGDRHGIVASVLSLRVGDIAL